jgi:probable rRNA maturation factor
MNLELNVVVQDERWRDALPEAETAVADAVVAARAELERPSDAPVSVVLADDAYVKELNIAYRGKKEATNVLAFPATAGPEPELGDVVLALETVVKEAESSGLPLRDRVAHMVVHGYFHLAGYDHQSEAEADVMENLERRALARLGMADPYESDGASVDA